MIETFFFGEPGRRLCATIHRPEGSATAGLLLCPPLLEERKGAVRPFFDLAERLVPLGVCSLRFDYRGTGDSEGDQEGVTVESCLEDTAGALGELRRRVFQPTLLLGLRLGGAIASLAAARATGFAGLVLWQPVVDGAVFFRMNLRRQSFRRSMIEAEGSSGNSAEGELVDLDGFVVARRFCESIGEVDLSTLQRPAYPAAIFQLSFNREPLRELARLADAWSAELHPIVCEPFWNRIGLVDCDQLVAQTADWIAARV